jgi:hypothetical protein
MMAKGWAVSSVHPAPKCRFDMIAKVGLGYLFVQSLPMLMDLLFFE